MKLAKFLNTYPLWAAYRLHEKLVVPMQKLLKEQELTFLQSLILAAMHFEAAPCSPSQLNEVFGTTLPNMSHSLKHLRTLGLVERQMNNSDGRKAQYTLTAQAHECLSYVINLHHNAQEAMERTHSPDDIAAWCEMARGLSRMNR